MDFQGYGVSGSFDGAVLRAEGSNKATKVALSGEGWADGVSIPVGQIADVTLKPAGRLTNGNLVVKTVDGRKVQLHYLRKHQSDFDALAAAIRA